MGWIISVGRAGANGRANGRAAQALSVRFDGAGVALQLKVRDDGVRSGDPLPARQAQRVWQKVLSTVVGID